MAENTFLQNAKASKNDEFYTLYEDIEREMNAYIEYNKDVFRGKTILLPCDDPEDSNFTRYFAANFERFGIKKLISTSYAGSSSSTELTLFQQNSPRFDKNKHFTKGKVFVLERDADGSGYINHEDIEFDYLTGDGDFRSKEVTALRDEADIIITNPPFSLFREFLDWVYKGGKDFIIIGNINCITYNEVFPKIRDNEMWLGTGMGRWISGFLVPDSYDLYGTEARIDSQGNHIVSTNNCLWLTNIEHGRRHDFLQLMSMDDNLKYNKTLKNRLRKKFGDDTHYYEYDNFDGIDVPFTEAIPSDYNGMMGVPITFLDKYNPDQFEIIGISGKLARPIMLDGRKRSGRFYINSIRMYDRIVIKKK